MTIREAIRLFEEYPNPTVLRTDVVEALQSLAATGGAVISDIVAERLRQVEAEGWSPEHDDGHGDGSLALAAALYATPIPLFEIIQRDNGVAWIDPWPWEKRITYHRYGDGDPTFMVPDGDNREKHDRRKALVVAAALIVADIERLDRAASRMEAQRGETENTGSTAEGGDSLTAESGDAQTPVPSSRERK